MTSARKPALTLHHFILRAQVLSFYRSVIRATRCESHKKSLLWPLDMA